MPFDDAGWYDITKHVARRVTPGWYVRDDEGREFLLVGWN
jgi:hypothetical protein